LLQSEIHAPALESRPSFCPRRAEPLISCATYLDARRRFGIHSVGHGSWKLAVGLALCLQRRTAGCAGSAIDPRNRPLRRPGADALCSRPAGRIVPHAPATGNNRLSSPAEPAIAAGPGPPASVPSTLRRTWRPVALAREMQPWARTMAALPRGRLDRPAECPTRCPGPNGHEYWDIRMLAHERINHSMLYRTSDPPMRPGPGRMQVTTG